MNEPCSICQDHMINPTRTVECGHYFCFECLFAWVKLRETCPLCRNRMYAIQFNFQPDGQYDEIEVLPNFDYERYITHQFNSHSIITVPNDLPALHIIEPTQNATGAVFYRESIMTRMEARIHSNSDHSTLFVQPQDRNFILNLLETSNVHRGIEHIERHPLFYKKHLCH